MTSQPEDKPRAPATIRALLRLTIERLEKGPEMSGATEIGSYSDDYKRGFDEACSRHRNWLSPWFLGPLRQVLCYLDGAASAHEIKTYGYGMDYPERRT